VVNKKAVVIGGAVVAAAVVYGATRTERGNRVREQVASKVNLPNTGRVVDDSRTTDDEQD